MLIVTIAALGVGGATILGAIIGFFVKKIPHRHLDAMMGFASGVMLAASMVGLIFPSIESGGRHGVLITAVGILSGALFLNFADRFTPHLHNVTGVDREDHGDTNLDRIMLFVMAIAIHNLPEGIAAGVGFATENVSGAVTVAIGIALQNIPEGIIVISPLLLYGVKKSRAFAIAAFTGIIEIIGTFIGYFFGSIVASILPFALAFAGGTMLYIISDEMIPETHSHGFERLATYSLLAGFILMLIMDAYIQV